MINLEGTRDNKKKIIKVSLFILVIVIIISVISILLMKYNVEGETNLPFELEEILVISSADANEINPGEKRWNLDILQNNDIYIEIKKNGKYNGNEELQKVIIQNITYNSMPQIGEPHIYKPSEEGDFTYIYSNESICDNNILEYNVTGSNNMKKMELANDGGVITFSSCSKNIAQYISDEDTEIKYDGSLLQKVNISKEQLKYKLSFEIIIETVSEKKYKASISLDIPIDNFITEGIAKKEIKNNNEIIFKRI